VKYVRRNFLCGLLGREPGGPEELNAQLRQRVQNVANQRVHGTTHEEPAQRWPKERVGIHASAFAGHSLRAGFAISTAATGKSERAIRNQTGDRSVAGCGVISAMAISSARMKRKGWACRQLPGHKPHCGHLEQESKHTVVTHQLTRRRTQLPVVSSLEASGTSLPDLATAWSFVR
jgi:hypothetical protein